MSHRESGAHKNRANPTASTARMRSFWQKLRPSPEHICDKLIASQRVFQYLDLNEVRHLGRQIVPLERIVGSSGRWQEFDITFRPIRGKSERWLHVASARVELPPVSLVKVGDAYFVEDGNHRISVAQARGADDIEAIVVELDASPLRPDPDCKRLGFYIK